MADLREMEWKLKVGGNPEQTGKWWVAMTDLREMEWKQSFYRIPAPIEKSQWPIWREMNEKEEVKQWDRHWLKDTEELALRVYSEDTSKAWDR